MLSIGLVAGALAGGITAILLAPTSGRETRKEIKTRTLWARNRILYRGLEEMQAAQENNGGKRKPK